MASTDIEANALAKRVFGGINALRWLLNLTTEFDRKDVRTRQAARLLDDFTDKHGRTHRQLLEQMWSELNGLLSHDDVLECLDEQLSQPAPSAPLEGTGNGADERAVATVVNVGPGEQDMEVELLAPLSHGTMLYARAPRTEVAGAVAIAMETRDTKDARYFRWLCAHPDWHFIESLCQQFAAESQVEFYTKLSAEIEKRIKHGANKGKKRLPNGSLAFPEAVAAAPQPPSADAAAAPLSLSEDQWLALAERHANRDWNSDEPDGFLAAVKILCADFASIFVRPTDDALWDQTLRERDDYEEWANKLAAAIASHFNADIGEHSNLNNPWQQALDALENSAAAPADERAALQWAAGTLQEIVSGRWKGAKESDKVSIGSVTKTVSQVLDMADAALGRASQPAAAAGQEAAPVCWITKEQLEQLKDLTSDAWVYWRETGHVAEDDELALCIAPPAQVATRQGLTDEQRHDSANEATDCGCATNEACKMKTDGSCWRAD